MKFLFIVTSSILLLVFILIFFIKTPLVYNDSNAIVKINSELKTELNADKNFQVTSESMPIKTITKQPASRPNNDKEIKKSRFPISMSEVVMTDALKNAFDEMGSYSFDLFDYKLGLYDRIQKCLNDIEPISSFGEIQLTLHFEVDPKTKIGVPTEFELEGSYLNKEDTIKFSDCAKQAHRNYDFNARGVDYQYTENDKELLVNMTLQVPLMNDFVYKFIEYEGHPPDE